MMNQELWQALSELTGARGPRNISWHYVRGHVGTPGNERCDTIADAFATANRSDSTMVRAGYTVDVHVLPDDTSACRTGAASGASKQRCGMLLFECRRRQADASQTWANVNEQRVKGVAGARFKKAMSATDEVEILRGWRVNPSDHRDAALPSSTLTASSAAEIDAVERPIVDEFGSLPRSSGAAKSRREHPGRTTSGWRPEHHPSAHPHHRVESAAWRGDAEHLPQPCPVAGPRWSMACALTTASTELVASGTAVRSPRSMSTRALRPARRRFRSSN